jgi:hypothetical protein
MSSQGTTIVSLLQSLRTFHKVEVSITAEQHEHLNPKATFQVANASSAMDAARAVEQYLMAKDWEFEWDTAPVKDVRLVAVNPLSDPDPKLFFDRTLICNQQPASEPKQRRVSFVACEREESRHYLFGGGNAYVYLSDGSHVFDLNENNEHALKCISNGSMVYMRPEETFTLPPSSRPPSFPEAQSPPPEIDQISPGSHLDDDNEDARERQRETELCLHAPTMTEACSSGRHDDCGDPVGICCDCSCHIDLSDEVSF